MMYQTGIVAVIKVNGNVLRETGDAVHVPFGSEYSILIKNLKSQRVMVKVSVDGTDISDGSSLVILPNSEVELERFIKNGNFNQGNKFKFIQITEEIEEHRGIKVDDGIIRIEYWTERIRPVVMVPTYHPYDAFTQYVWPPIHYTYPTYYSSNYGSGVSCGSIFTNNVSPTFDANVRGVECCATPDIKGEGITVPGSISNQQFSTTGWFETNEQSEVVILKLRGKVANKKVIVPLAVKSKLVCSTCGKRSKSNVEFCSRCGTALEIV